MPADTFMRPTFRFAPSPNGALHLGHALSAMLNAEVAAQSGGRFLLRIENTDQTRANNAIETAMITDLHWLGLEWEQPVRRQSEHRAEYHKALDTLIGAGLVYPAFLTRGEMRALTGADPHWPRDPDGVPLYPPADRERSSGDRDKLLRSGIPFAWRLNMHRAVAIAGSVSWIEEGSTPYGKDGEVCFDPRCWGDVVIARAEFPASYHLAVVVDDAVQGVTTVIRGRDLFCATAIHRLLQVLLELPQPRYRHHRLILGSDGRKLSKSERSQSLASLREAGWTAADVRRAIGL